MLPFSVTYRFLQSIFRVPRLVLVIWPLLIPALLPQTPVSTLHTLEFTFSGFTISQTPSGYQISSVSGNTWQLGKGMLTPVNSATGNAVFLSVVNFPANKQAVTITCAVLVKGVESPRFFSISSPFDLPLPLFAVNGRGEVGIYNVIQNSVSVNTKLGTKHFPLGAPPPIPHEVTARIIATADTFLLATADGASAADGNAVPAMLVAFNQLGLLKTHTLPYASIQSLICAPGMFLVSGTIQGGLRTEILSTAFTPLRSFPFCALAGGYSNGAFLGIAGSGQLFRLTPNFELTLSDSGLFSGSPMFLGVAAGGCLFAQRSVMGLSLRKIGFAASFENIEYSGIFKANHNLGMVADGDQVFVFSNDKTLVFQ